MPYRKWQTTERQYEKPMRQILIELYEKFGDHEMVREFLGLTQKGLREWIAAVECEPVTRLRCVTPEQPAQLNTHALSADTHARRTDSHDTSKE